METSRKQEIIAFAEHLQVALSSREDSAIPDTPGLCIDGGFLAGSKLAGKEACDTGIRFPSRPDVLITVQSWQVTEPVEDTIFVRMPLISETAKELRQGSRMLRRREHAAWGPGGQMAQELCLHVKPEGKNGYDFLIETYGVTNSLTDTQTSIEMTTYDRFDKYGNVMETSFKDDGEALAFWDAIVGSFCTRPNAA